MLLGTLMAKIGGDTGPLRAAETETKALLNKMSSDVSAFGMKWSLAISTPLSVFAGFAIKAQSSAEQVEKSYASAFEAVGNSAQAAADKVSRSLGFGGSTARGLMGDLGRRFIGLGLDPAAALKQSEDVVKMSADLASWSGRAGDVEQVARAMSYALMGSTRALMQYGIRVDETEVSMKLAALGAKNMTAEQLSQSRAMAMLEIVQKKLRMVEGAWAKDDSFAKRWFVLRDRLTDYREAMGKLIIDGLRLKEVMGWLSQQLDTLNSALGRLGPMTKSLLVGGGLMAILVGPGLMILPQLISGVSLLATTLPTILALGAALGGIAFAVYKIGRMYGWWDEVGRTVMNAAKGDVTDLFNLIADGVDWLGGFLGKPLDVLNEYINTLQIMVQYIADIFTGLFDILLTSWKKMLTDMVADATLSVLPPGFRELIKLASPSKATKERNQTMGEVISRANEDALLGMAEMAINQLFGNLWGAQFQKVASRLSAELRGAGKLPEPEGAAGGKGAAGGPEQPPQIEAAARQYAGAAVLGSVEAYRIANTRFDSWQTKSLDYLREIADNTAVNASGDGLALAPEI